MRLANRHLPGPMVGCLRNIRCHVKKSFLPHPLFLQEGSPAAGVSFFAPERLQTDPVLGLPWRRPSRVAAQDRTLQITFCRMIKSFDFIFLNLEP